MTDSVPEEMLTVAEQLAHGPRDVPASREELVDLLFRRHYNPLLRLAVVMVGDREAAEDAVQEAFVSLHRNWRKLRDPEAAEAYVRSAVLNRCRSWVRRQAVQRAKKPLLLVREDPPAGPEDTAVGNEQVGSLIEAMRTMARRQREVLACRYVLQLSVAETAAQLDISEGSVKRHAFRALQALQQRMEVAR